MKTKHAAGLIAVVLVLIVGAIPGLAQEGVSSPASEPAILGETNHTLSVEVQDCLNFMNHHLIQASLHERKTR